jgi:uncharacterized protein (TIGR02145 family)
VYESVVIGSQEWLIDNLRRDDYGVIASIDTPADVVTYGRGYYPSEFLAWNDFLDGWHVPAESEWTTLFTEIGSTFGESYGGYWIYAGKKLKEAGTDHWVYTSSPGTDDYGFRVRGSGYWIGPPYYYDWDRKNRTGLASTTVVNNKLINFQMISGESSLDSVDGARRVQDSLTPWVSLAYAVRLVRDVQSKFYVTKSNAVKATPSFATVNGVVRSLSNFVTSNGAVVRL